MTNALNTDILFQIKDRQLFGVIARYIADALRFNFYQDRFADHLTKIMRISKTTAEIYIYALALFIKYANRMDTQVTPQNTEKFFFAAVIIATDFLSDEYFTLETWHKISGRSIAMERLSYMQRIYLDAFDWNIIIRGGEYHCLLVDLASRCPECGEGLESSSEFIQIITI